MPNRRRARCGNSPTRSRTKTRSRRPTSSPPKKSDRCTARSRAPNTKRPELQLVQTAGAPLAGVDFDVQDLKLSTESLADGFAKVTVDQGTFTASTHKAQFSALMQKVLRASHDNSTSAELDRARGGTRVADLRRRGAHRRQVVRECGLHRARVHPGVQPPARGRLRFRGTRGCDSRRGDAGRRGAGLDAGVATVGLDEAVLDGSARRAAGVRLPRRAHRAHPPQSREARRRRRSRSTR